MLDLLPADARPKRIGADKYVTLCLFHSEDRPSMRVTLHRGVWRFRCFPCGANGDVFDLLMRLRGVTFGEALRQLADGCSLDLTVTTPTRRRVPPWLLACDGRGCTASVEVEDEDVVYLGETLHTAWWIGAGYAAHRAYCPRCVAALISSERCPPLAPLEDARAAA